MERAIIYMQDSGAVAVIYPTRDALNLFGIENIAKKDVPSGKPYKIIDVTDLPNDRTFRDAWVVDSALLSDGIGADYGVGSAFDVIGYKSSEVVIVRDQETGNVFERPVG